MDEGRITVAEGVALHVRRWPGAGAGSGVPFLLVHGLASNARMWDGVAAVLSAAGHEVAAVDLRGHGQSDKPDHGYDFATIVADLAMLIDGLGFERPVVVGQSWGGNVVLELAARRGPRVRGIACVDGGTIELSRRFPTWEECAAKLAPPVLAGRPWTEVESELRRRHPGWPESGIAGFLANFERRADDTIAPWLSRDRHMQILRALWEHRPSLVAGSVEVPVLVIPAVGGADKEADVAAVAERLPHGRVAWLDGDHDLHAEQPAAVAALLLDGFLT
jgi:pimeloyl-ACP methyl ester carboxylesterase